MNQIKIHHHVVAETPGHNKEMEDLVAAEVFMSGIKNRQLQRIDDAAHGIKNSSGQEPEKCGAGKIAPKLAQCKYTEPSHGNIQHGRNPSGAVYPESL